jgi:hypothetical protein
VGYRKEKPKGEGGRRGEKILTAAKKQGRILQEQEAEEGTVGERKDQGSVGKPGGTSW